MTDQAPRPTPPERLEGPLGRLLSRLGYRLIQLLLPLLPGLDTRASPTQAGRQRVTFLLLNAYAVGGTVRTAFNLAGYLAADYDVEIVSVKRRRIRNLLPFPEGVTVTALDDLFRRRGRLGRFVYERLAALPSRMINVQDRRYDEFTLFADMQMRRYLRGLEGVLVTTRPGLNLVGVQHAGPRLRVIGQEHMNLASHRPLLRADIQRHYPDLDALAVLTRADLREYGQLFGTRPPRRLLHMPNAVPVIEGDVSDLSRKVVVTAGRLTRQKGYDMLVPAWAEVARTHPDWRLVIFGEGEQRPVLEKLVADHGLGDSVSLPGRTDQIGHEFSRAAAFVLSSRREGLPMVMLEAMSKGLPVVSFDCPTGPAELVTDENGILVPDADVEALSRALCEIIEDGELRRRLGRGALETAARYDVDVIGRAWVDLVEELFAETAAR